MARVVLVVDMVQGFLQEQCPLYCGESAREIIPRVRKLLQKERAQGSHIIYLCDQHTPDDPEFRLFPPHCVQGTPEAQIIPELADYPGRVIAKTRYSGFFGTPLPEILDSLRPEALVICGVCTDICVLHTAADARNRDYPVEVPVDAVASFDPQAHEFALRHLQKVLGVTLVAVEEDLS